MVLSRRVSAVAEGGRMTSREGRELFYRLNREVRSNENLPFAETYAALICVLGEQLWRLPEEGREALLDDVANQLREIAEGFGGNVVKLREVVE